MNTQTTSGSNPTTNPSSTSSSQHVGKQALQDQARVIGDDVKELGHLAKDAASEAVAHGKQAGAEMLSTARERASEYEESVVRYMRQNPVRSLAYAAGIGLAVGLIVRR